MYEEPNLFKGLLYGSNLSNVKIVWVSGFYLPKAETTYAFSSDNKDGRATPHDFILFDTMSDWSLPNSVRVVPVIDGSVCINTQLKIGNAYVYSGDIILVSENGVETEYYVKYDNNDGKFVLVNRKEHVYNHPSLSSYISRGSLTDSVSVSIVGNIMEEKYFSE